MSPPPLLLPLLAVLVASAAAQGGLGTERVDLYQGDPHVVHLDNSTFFSALLDRPHAWAMEFYMDWCGHCQRFTPIWSQVARRAKDWGAVIKVGAINCARRRNSALCREMGVLGVPNVQLFGPRVTRGEPGYSGIQHDPDKMTETLIEFVTTVQRREQPRGWPQLSEYSGSVLQLRKNPEPLQALILEAPGRSMGRSVQLDLSPHQPLVRVSRTSHLPADLTSRPASLPALLMVNADDGSYGLVTASPGEDPRALFSSTIRESIGVADTTKNASQVLPTAAPAPTPAPTRAPADMVFLVDMENAIVVALKQEVTSYKVLEGEALEALRGFVRVLIDLFPGRSHLMGSLQQLLRAITGPERVSGEALERLLKSSSPWWPGLPKLQPYQACRGSRPNYRGYSCGLWTLFHTLTVQEFRKAGDAHEASVLPAVHGYVKNFFSCKHCSRHFQQMAAEDGLFNVTSTEDSLLWLWRAHNKVNGRIAGDVTDDPLHPKRQFPDDKLCPECFNGEEYDRYDVLQFLVQFYAEENFRGEGLDPMPVADLPSQDGMTSDSQTNQPAGETVSISAERSPLSPRQQASDIASSTRSQAPSHHTAQESAPSAGGSAPSADQSGSSSVLSPQTYRAPLLRRSGLPPPVVLPPQPGRPEVLPGIMRYPSEMAHVFPTVVRAAPAEEAEVQTGAGLSRAERRVTHSQPRVVFRRPRVVQRRPRVVYRKPRVVYARPRVVYTQPRVVYSGPRVAQPLYSRHSAQDGVQNVHSSSGADRGGDALTQGSSHSVRRYWIRAH